MTKVMPFRIAEQATILWRFSSFIAVPQFSWSFQGHAGRLFLEKKPFPGITFPLRQLENRYKTGDLRVLCWMSHMG
jgi:hypothetical protein